MKQIIYTLLLVCTSTITSWGQDSTRTVVKTDSIQVNTETVKKTISPNKPYLGLGLAMVSYRGDLVNTYQFFTPNIELYIRFNRKKYINGQFTFGFGKLSASNPYYTYNSPNTNTIPNTNFNTQYQYFKYELNLNLLTRKNWKVNVSQGIGFMHFVPKNQDNQNLLEMNNTRAADESYSSVCLILPSSIGILYTTPINYTLGFKIGLINPQTDYIDNISTLSNESKKDNVLSFQFSINAPITLEVHKSK